MTQCFSFDLISDHEEENDKYNKNIYKGKLNEFLQVKGLNEVTFQVDETKDGFKAIVSLAWLSEEGSIEKRKQDAENTAAKNILSKLSQLFKTGKGKLYLMVFPHKQTGI